VDLTFRNPMVIPYPLHVRAAFGESNIGECKKFPKDGATRATKVLEIVHSNVCGPMKNMSLGGARYFLTFIDDFSRKMWVYPLKAKNECFERFKEFKALAEKEVETHIKVLRSDNGGEYTSHQFEDYLKA
jgi:transposase InsO family protein